MQLLKTGTRDSELAVWQARQVQSLLKQNAIESHLIFITSEGDADLITPLYEMGVQGIFTKTLDAALLNKRIDIAVHSMKDVPTQLPQGIRQAAVLPRASYKDLLVLKGGLSTVSSDAAAIGWGIENGHSGGNGSAAPRAGGSLIVATGSIRRKAQWLHRHPNDTIENLRGNINTRLSKLEHSNWYGAIFAAAGLERINLRPQHSIELHWMVPAPAQGAIMVVCREDDDITFDMCQAFNDKQTEVCTKIERDFLKKLLGGCSTPISALAEMVDDKIIFKGNICAADGNQMIGIQKDFTMSEADEAGNDAAGEMLKNPVVKVILQEIQDAKK